MLPLHLASALLVLGIHSIKPLYIRQRISLEAEVEAICICPQGKQLGQLTNPARRKQGPEHPSQRPQHDATRPAPPAMDESRARPPVIAVAHHHRGLELAPPRQHNGMEGVHRQGRRRASALPGSEELARGPERHVRHDEDAGALRGRRAGQAGQGGGRWSVCNLLTPIHLLTYLPSESRPFFSFYSPM